MIVPDDDFDYGPIVFWVMITIIVGGVITICLVAS
jgi:hypothetical protein